MAKLQPIAAFKTSDGKVFQDRDTAAHHQQQLNLREFFAREGVGRGGEWDAEMFSQFIENNWDTITQIMTGELR